MRLGVPAKFRGRVLKADAYGPRSGYKHALVSETLRPTMER